MKSPYYLDNLTKYEELKDELDELYKITDKQYYTSVTYRGTKIEGVDNSNSDMKRGSYEDAYNYTSYILSKLEALKKENPKLNVHIGQINLFGELCSFDNYPKLVNWIKQKTFELYKHKLPPNVDADIITIDTFVPTLYTHRCLLSNHLDGRRDDEDDWDFVKFANVLLYLNKDYKVENGGLFVVDDIHPVIPEFGNIVFLNLYPGSDPSHQVTEIIGQDDRFAILFAAIYKKRDLVKYL